ncbi:amidinotransferase [Actinorhabdospora filicis]|uniref:Amidinotransferase n=1 Tax=Actinorhabdospora filicis TaxID=1785913 RepID=A0A9W6SMA7_9ACTN|nr:hypothetical protein [Actinorhabdospora filicis]GLZ78598.1 amidinotransferase [Actinorhabdospora filicis]
MTDVHVESEFAPLRTVVLARCELAVPAPPPGSPELRFLREGAAERNSLGRDLREADPARHAAWEREREAFGAVLAAHGVEVLRPRLLTEEEKRTGTDGYANFFSRDPFFTVGGHVIEGSLRLRHRRREILPIRDILDERVLPADCSYVAVPRPGIATAGGDEPGPFLEGGDVLVLGKRVFVGASGLASNERGARWLRKLLEPRGYTVELVPLHDHILHLDCALGLIREGLLVHCPEAMPGGLPESLRGWDAVTVTFDQATSLATNGLPITPGVYVTDPEFAFLGDRLAEHGVRVEYVDFAITRSFGGSFRCSTQALLRRE